MCQFTLQEGFAFAHCTTCKAPYHLRVHVAADRKWRTLKFRFFVTRDILFIFLTVQLVGHWLLFLAVIFRILTTCLEIFKITCFLQVIASLAYLVYLTDGYQHSWLRRAWGFDSDVTFYYICGKISFLKYPN